VPRDADEHETANSRSISSSNPDNNIRPLYTEYRRSPLSLAYIALQLALVHSCASVISVLRKPSVPASLDKRQLGPWWNVDADKMKAFICDFQQPFPLIGFALFRIEQFQHRKIEGSGSRSSSVVMTVQIGLAHT